MRMHDIDESTANRQSRRVNPGLLVAIVASIALTAGYAAGQALSLSSPPTSVDTTLMRGAVGSILANRTTNKKHTGVDIVANQSAADREVYRVMAVRPGTVAYGQINGSETSGFGFTVVIDHGDGVYTQYSHLAVRASRDVVKVGDKVSAGQTIGYMGDPANGERSSGNTEASSVKPFDKIQLHFEVFRAPAGAQSRTTLTALKNSCEWLDPTAELKRLGYKAF